LRRGGRVAEGARLESVYTGNRIVGSNPTPSARPLPERFSGQAPHEVQGAHFWLGRPQALDSARNAVGQNGSLLALVSLKLCTFTQRYGFPNPRKYRDFPASPIGASLNPPRLSGFIAQRHCRSGQSIIPAAIETLKLR
jgi:hypothetical protein